MHHYQKMYQKLSEFEIFSDLFIFIYYNFMA